MRGMKKSGTKSELIRLLSNVWPTGLDDQRTTRCSLCKVSIRLPDLVDHFKLCKKIKEDEEKKKKEPFKIPKAVNTYDDLVRRRNAISAFKSSDLVKKSVKRSKPFETPYKETIKLIIKGAGSRYFFYTMLQE